MKEFGFTVKFANGHKVKVVIKAKDYLAAYIEAVTKNVVNPGDTVVPNSF